MGQGEMVGRGKERDGEGNECGTLVGHQHEGCIRTTATIPTTTGHSLDMPHNMPGLLACRWTGNQHHMRFILGLFYPAPRQIQGRTATSKPAIRATSRSSRCIKVRVSTSKQVCSFTSWLRGNKWWLSESEKGRASE